MRFESWGIGYLANSVWMVPLVFCAAWVAARAMRRVSVGAEHRVWVAALAMEVLLPGLKADFVGVWQRAVAAVLLMVLHWMAVWGHGSYHSDIRVVVAQGTVHGRGGFVFSRGAMIAVAAVYVCVAIYFAARLLWGLWRTFKVLREAEPLAENAIAERWTRHAREARVEDAWLLGSASVSGPATVGILWPALIVPHGFFEGVGVEETDALMAHECAHMCRRDFAKNVLYNVLVLPASYHPVLWATWSRMTESREMVCDAMAAKAVEGRERYARSLLWLAALMIDKEPVKSIHAIGIFDANSLEGRIMQLMRRSEAGRGVRAVIVAACVTIGVATCASAMALRMEVGAAEKNAQPSTARVPAGVMAAQAISQKHPVYPPDAKAKKIQGAVVLKALISKEGTVENLQVVSGPEELRGSSLDAVKDWTYKPYLLNGEPTEVETTITVNYHVGG